MSVDALLRQAIAERRLIQFDYRAAWRVVEPHDYGVNYGQVRLLAFQLRGASRGRLPGWRMFDVARIEGLIVLPETFRGSRGGDSRTHKTWEQIFCRVS